MLQILDAQEESTRTLVHDTGVVFDALTEREGQLRELVRNSNRVFQATADRDAELADTFRVLPTFLDESRATTERVTTFAKATDPLVTQLRPAARELSPTLIALNDLAPDLKALFRDLGPLIRVSRRGLPATERFLNETRPLLAQLDPFLRNLNPILAYAGNYKKEIAAFFALDAAATQATDSPPGAPTTIHYLRTTNPLNPENLAVYPKRISTNRSNPYVEPGGYAKLPDRTRGVRHVPLHEQPGAHARHPRRLHPESTTRALIDSSCTPPAGACPRRSARSRRRSAAWWARTASTRTCCRSRRPVTPRRTRQYRPATDVPCGQGRNPIPLSSCCAERLSIRTDRQEGDGTATSDGGAGRHARARGAVPGQPPRAEGRRGHARGHELQGVPGHRALQEAVRRRARGDPRQGQPPEDDPHRRHPADHRARGLPGRQRAEGGPEEPAGRYARSSPSCIPPRSSTAPARSSTRRRTRSPTGFQQQGAAQAKRAKDAGAAARKASKQRGDSRAEQDRLAKAAENLVMGQFVNEALKLGLRYGLRGIPRVDDPSFVSQLVFDPAKGPCVPKGRFSYLFPSCEGALILVRLRPNLNEDERSRALDLIRGATQDPSFKPERGARYVVSGVPAVVDGLSDAVQSAIFILLAAALLVMAGTLLVVFRSRLRLLPLALALGAAALAFGAVSVAGASLTMASIAALPVLIGLAVDYAIQFQARFDERMAETAEAPPPEAASRDAAMVGGPTIAAAGLSTAVGFLVLLLSPVPMVRGFAIVLVVGIAFALLCALTAGFAALTPLLEA